MVGMTRFAQKTKQRMSRSFMGQESRFSRRVAVENRLRGTCEAQKKNLKRFFYVITILKQGEK